MCVVRVFALQASELASQPGVPVIVGHVQHADTDRTDSQSKLQLLGKRVSRLGMEQGCLQYQ